MRKRELIEVVKQKVGWRCEYKLGRLRQVLLIQDPLNKEAVINLMAKKFNLTPEKVERVVK